MEQVKKFMEKLQNDEALKAKFDELGKNKTGLDDIIALAAENGFIFTEGDWKNCVNAELGGGKQELGEEELETVSGGGWDFVGCRFIKEPGSERVAAASRYMNDAWHCNYVRKCKYYRVPIICTGVTCGCCYNDDCCHEGFHLTDINGEAVHELIYYPK